MIGKIQHATASSPEGAKGLVKGVLACVRYKKEIPEFEKDSLQKELFKCAQMINTLDQRMEAVKNRLAAGGQWEKS